MQNSWLFINVRRVCIKLHKTLSHCRESEPIICYCNGTVRFIAYTHRWISLECGKRKRLNKAIHRKSHIARAVCAPHHPRWRWSDLFYCTTLFAASALQCIFNGEENPQVALSSWNFVTLPEGDRATAIGNNMHRKIGKDRARGSGDILADRQTHRHAHTHTHTHTYTHTHHNTSPQLPRAK